VYASLDFAVERGQRIALVGENGAGKSTLLKLLAGVTPLDKGTRAVGHGVTLHYFAQHQAETLNPEHTILDSLHEVAIQAETNFLRGIAGAFLFSGPDQKKPVKALSGGERNRVALARMLVEPANTLLLDEPTNHLDPASVDVLTDALVAFPGTLIFISHDPTFLSRIANRVVEIDDGQAKDYLGDYEYYLWKRSKELEEFTKDQADDRSAGTNGNGRTNGSNPGAGSSKGKATERRELIKAEARLEKQVARAEALVLECEARIKVRDGELADPQLYEDFDRWKAMHQEHELWKQDLERSTATWEELSQELERVRGSLAGLG
jgi:ATP-binding cassette subfamily F protein 3